MDFNKLTIENFGTIVNAELELNNRGLLVIQGINSAATSADSNGAGKSTIPDALCWCLYGETARGITGDAVVNRKSGKGTRVMTEIVEGDTTFEIIRHRKHATHKNALMIRQINNTTLTVVDLTKGTDKETQLEVNKAMGCSVDVFVGAVYAGQEKTPDLPGMTDKALKAIIEEAAGTTELSAGYAEARQRLLAAKSKVEAAMQRLSDERIKKPALQAELRSLTEAVKAFEEKRKPQASDKLREIAPLNEAIKLATEELTTIDVPGITAQRAKLQEALDGRAAEDAEMARLNSEHSEAQRLVDKITGEAQTMVAEKKRLTEALVAAPTDTMKDCGTCGRGFAEEDQEAARAHKIKHLQEALDELNGKAPDLKARLSAAREALERASKRGEDRRATMTDVSAAARDSEALRASLDRARTLETAIARDNASIETIRTAARAFLTAANPWEKAIEVKHEEIKRNQDTLDKLEAGLLTSEEEIVLFDEAVKVFGPAGVRAHILDTITPLLNEKTREYLGAIADGDIQAVWSTLAMTAKKEMREKFNIEVTSDSGGDEFKALSGGEKRKVRLSAMLALQDLVASRATKPINLFVADEIDHALDGAGLERLMGVLERKARERGTVLVISHNSLSDWIPNEIVVTKTAKHQSEVTGATHAGF